MENTCFILQENQVQFLGQGQFDMSSYEFLFCFFAVEFHLMCKNKTNIVLFNWNFAKTRIFKVLHGGTSSYKK